MTDIQHTRTVAAAAASSVRHEPDLTTLRCVAHVAAPAQLPRLKKLCLSVAEPCACFPCFSRKRVIACFRFKGDAAWLRQHEDGHYEQSSGDVTVNIGRLRRLDEGLQIKVTCKAQRHKSSARGTKSLGDFLNELEVPTRVHLLPPVSLTLHMVVGPSGAQHGWVVPLNEAQDAQLTFDAPASHGAEAGHHQAEGCHDKDHSDAPHQEHPRKIVVPPYYEAPNATGTKAVLEVTTETHSIQSVRPRRFRAITPPPRCRTQDTTTTSTPTSVRGPPELVLVTFLLTVALLVAIEWLAP